jgi:hypothetical protein
MFGYIEPIEVKLGEISRNFKVRMGYITKTVDAVSYAVPFIPQSQQLLSMPEVYRCLNENNNNGMTYMSAGMDGCEFMLDEYIQQHPQASVISLYTDEFEIVNPIGSHKRKQNHGILMDLTKSSSKV